MCRDCGCQQGNARAWAHDHGHHHDHDHDHGSGAARRRIDLETRVLAHNDAAAADNRRRLEQRGVVAVNLISSPGSGKTTLLERTLERLEGELSCAVIAGDQQTDNDARRLEGRGARVRQIETGSACHLDASQVGRVLDEALGDDTRLLLIENVGNLVCPAAFDLGERHRVTLLSVTEGEDKPLKYPLPFHDADVVLITKVDLLPYLDWDRQACHRALEKVGFSGRRIELSARTGEGLDAWVEWLAALAPVSAPTAGPARGRASET
ncbi:MAG: hydrogenase nickel incorporation protein HypB [Acidobacteriota bacterium]|nr:hydrogenase nickel incorporation protein HypB [Acidobacteriota bacterium]MDQ7086419.1 hydrogenase nickel incorporation protein HypB [Acidobacteriota bacterium]